MSDSRDHRGEKRRNCGISYVRDCQDEASPCRSRTARRVEPRLRSPARSGFRGHQPGAIRSARPSGRRAGLDGAPAAGLGTTTAPPAPISKTARSRGGRRRRTRRPLTARACPEGVPVGEGVRWATLRAIKRRSSPGAGCARFAAVAVVGMGPHGALACRAQRSSVASTQTTTPWRKQARAQHHQRLLRVDKRLPEGGRSRPCRRRGKHPPAPDPSQSAWVPLGRARRSCVALPSAPMNSGRSFVRRFGIPLGRHAPALRRRTGLPSGVAAARARARSDCGPGPALASGRLLGDCGDPTRRPKGAPPDALPQQQRRVCAPPATLRARTVPSRSVHGGAARCAGEVWTNGRLRLPASTVRLRWDWIGLRVGTA